MISNVHLKTVTQVLIAVFGRMRFLLDDIQAGMQLVKQIDILARILVVLLKHVPALQVDRHIVGADDHDE